MIEIVVQVAGLKGRGVCRIFNGNEAMFWKTKTTETTVRFTGGPLDGHVQTTHVADPASILAYPVTPNLYRFLNGLPPAGSARPTSVAFYAGQAEGDGWHYKFLRAVALEDVPQVCAELSQS